MASGVSNTSRSLALVGGAELTLGSDTCEEVEDAGEAGIGVNVPLVSRVSKSVGKTVAVDEKEFFMLTRRERRLLRMQLWIQDLLYLPQLWVCLYFLLPVRRLKLQGSESKECEGYGDDRKQN